MKGVYIKPLVQIQELAWGGGTEYKRGLSVHVSPPSVASVREGVRKRGQCVARECIRDGILLQTLPPPTSSFL